MSPTELENAANEVAAYLQREGAVRVSVDEIAGYKTVFEICSDLGITNWAAVKIAMLRRGIPIVYIPNRGHFLGFKGEEITNVVYKHKIARGWVKHLRATKDAIKASSPEAKAWIARRFNEIDVEGEENPHA